MTITMAARRAGASVEQDLREFQAWRRPVQSFPVVDHACVTYNPHSDDLGIFQCYGNDTSITPAFSPVSGTQGPGDYTVANAHRCPPQDSAELGLYGTHGVCHQAANRFLSCVSREGGPAPTLNNEVRGYWLSKAIYGVYGFGWNGWQTLTHQVEAFLADVRTAVPGANQAAVRGLHETALARKAELDAESLTGRAYVERLNALTEAFQRSMAETMTAQEYRSLTGVEPGEILELIPPDKYDLVGWQAL